MSDFLNQYRYWIFGALAIALLYQFVGPQDKRSIVAPVDDEVFQAEIANSQMPVLVKFGATWCGPCKVMDKELDAYESTMNASESTQKVKIVRLDVDANPKLASHYGVSSIPQTFVFEQGKVLGHQVGALDADKIRTWVDSLVKSR